MMAIDHASLEQSQAEEESDPFYAELKRLFYLYRLANLNARYYGRRAAWFEGLLRYSLVAVTTLSALALSLVLGVDPKESWARNSAAVGSGIATVLLAVIPSLGWTDKIRELRNLHFGYSQLFTRIEWVMTEIRRVDRLTEEHVGMSSAVHEDYLGLHAQDELETKEKVRDQEEAKMRESIPDNYVWDRF